MDVPPAARPSRDSVGCGYTDPWMAPAAVTSQTGWARAAGCLGGDEDAEGVAVEDSLPVVETRHDAALGAVLGGGDHAGAGAGRAGRARRVDAASIEGPQATASRQSL